MLAWRSFLMTTCNPYPSVSYPQQPASRGLFLFMRITKQGESLRPVLKTDVSL